MRDTVRKTLGELAEDYYEAVRVLESRIADRNKRLKEYSPASREAAKLKSELNILYSERRDTMEAARFLKEYYLGKEE